MRMCKVGYLYFHRNKSVSDSNDFCFFSEQNVKPGTPLIENKKKKERRKEKDSSAIETSDEEANNSQGNFFNSLSLLNKKNPYTRYFL